MSFQILIIEKMIVGRMKKFVVAMDSQPSGIRAQEKVFSIFKKYGLLKKMGLKESVELDEGHIVHRVAVVGKIQRVDHAHGAVGMR